MKGNRQINAGIWTLEKERQNGRIKEERPEERKAGQGYWKSLKKRERKKGIHAKLGTETNMYLCRDRCNGRKGQTKDKHPTLQAERQVGMQVRSGRKRDTHSGKKVSWKADKTKERHYGGLTEREVFMLADRQRGRHAEREGGIWQTCKTKDKHAGRQAEREPCKKIWQTCKKKDRHAGRQAERGTD